MKIEEGGKYLLIKEEPPGYPPVGSIVTASGVPLGDSFFPIIETPDRVGVYASNVAPLTKLHKIMYGIKNVD